MKLSAATFSAIWWLPAATSPKLATTSAAAANTPASSITLADIALGCALGYLDLRFPEIDWRARHANLARHFDKLMLRPAFADTVPPAA